MNELVPKAELVTEAIVACEHRLELAFARWAAYVCLFAYIAGFFPETVLLVPLFAHMASWTATAVVRYRLATRQRAALIERSRARLAILANEIVHTKEAS